MIHNTCVGPHEDLQTYNSSHSTACSTVKLQNVATQVVREYPYVATVASVTGHELAAGRLKIDEIPKNLEKCKETDLRETTSGE
jgi:hypothetical protein